MSVSPILSIRPLGFPWETQDPFLFCVHHKDDYPQGRPDLTPDAALEGRMIGQDFTIKDGWRMYHGQKIPGFPYHPHRGFETVTITETGLIDHSDSLGAAGRFGEGDVQWMTAGRGVQHSEMFPMLHQDKSNPLEFFQLWLNLPKRSKMVDPHFAMMWDQEVPVVEITDDGGRKTTVRVVSGTIDGASAPVISPSSWAADPDNEVVIWVISMDAHAQWTIPAASPHVNRTLYLYRGGEVDIDSTKVDIGHAIRVRPEEALSLTASKKGNSLLILQGKPIGEPVAQHGPFVMNTQEEIQEAFAEYRRTEFGGWPWPEREQVHGADRGRFAKYADGREEVM